MKKTLPAIVLMIVLSVGLAGCQSTTAARPSLAIVTTQTQAAFDAVVIAIKAGIDADLIDKAVYWRDIDPVVVAAQASCKSMRDNAVKGDVTATQAASDAVLAAVAKLAPYVRFPPTTTKAN